jgi:predicted phosphodiesterase
MRWLIYSDVHGNLPAFEQMLKHCRGEYDAVACLGDLVNYGPWSNECVQLAASLDNPIYLMGNHEEAFIAGSYPGSNSLVQQFFQMTFPQFSEGEFIRSFLPEIRLGNYVLTHTIENRYIYPDSTVDLKQNYFVGHSHHQFYLQSNGFELYNPGSVGQNRKFINQACYLIFDDISGEVNLRQVKYDVDLVLQKMKEENYPAECITYYRTKERI